MRSACVRIMVSNSRRTPPATPAASFISLPTSSKKRLVVWVIGELHGASSGEWGERPRGARAPAPHLRPGVRQDGGACAPGGIGDRGVACHQSRDDCAVDNETKRMRQLH